MKERYHGGYALITGATDGLGKIYAINLAKKGFNLVLVSRNSEKLENVLIFLIVRSKMKFNKCVM